MGWDVAPIGQTPTLGYDRAAVEAFLGAAADERAKLEEQIEQSNLRLARARTALGTHRVMVAMLLQAQRELSALRRDAEREAAAIIAAAEREASSRASDPARAATPEAPAIDLREPEGTAPATPGLGFLDDELLVAAGMSMDDEFFEYLRGALIDDEPLGPRSEGGSTR
jgi:regulator of protease activity HflC (stomatin/prohibitin superfamily)